MKRLGLFLLLAPFITASIAQNGYDTSNSHYHQKRVNKTHTHLHDNSRHHHRSAVKQKSHHYPNYANTKNQISIHPDSGNIAVHRHD